MTVPTTPTPMELETWNLSAVWNLGFGASSHSQQLAPSLGPGRGRPAVQELLASFERFAGGLVVRGNFKRGAQGAAGFGNVARLQITNPKPQPCAVMVRVQVQCPPTIRHGFLVTLGLPEHRG